MYPKHIARMMVVLSIALLATEGGAWHVVTAQEPGEKAGPAGVAGTSDAVAAGRLEEMKRTAGRYTIVVDAEPPTPLTLLTEPVLRWNNPIHGATDGGTFLWVRSGRPEVVATVYRKKPDGVATERHEFQSLAGVPLKATFDGRLIWAPREPGINLAPIPGAPAPATTPAERLRQIRSLVRDFQVETDRGDGPTRLRLLPHPLYRYVPTRPDLTDGALFAFVLTTDPDALLAIEARSYETASAWSYGFGRMTSKSLTAKYQGLTVWQAPGFEISPKDPALPYVGIPSPEPSP
jgi:hypothetical protein